MNTCNCIEKVLDLLKKQHGVEVELELKPFINLESGTTGVDFPPLNYTYMAGKKRKRNYVTFNFCPICGKKK